MREEYFLADFKEMLNELYHVNEVIMSVYLGKSFSKAVKDEHLYPPNMLKDITLETEFLDKILKV